VNIEDLDYPPTMLTTQSALLQAQVELNAAPALASTVVGGTDAGRVTALPPPSATGTVGAQSLLSNKPLIVMLLVAAVLIYLMREAWSNGSQNISQEGNRSPRSEKARRSRLQGEERIQGSAMNDGEVQQLSAIVGVPNSLAMAQPIQTIPGDAAIDITRDGTFLLTKGSAAAISVAAPGAANIGRILVFMTGSDFAHVVTFTGSTLRDGTTGASITYTATAFQGCSLAVRAVSATIWNVLSQNLGAIA
jgi:hypothetical protein